MFDPIELMVEATEETMGGIAKAVFGGSSGTAEVEEEEDEERVSDEKDERNHYDPDDDDDGDDYTTYAESPVTAEDVSSSPASAGPIIQPLVAQSATEYWRVTDRSTDRTRHKIDHRVDDRSRHR